MQFTENRFRVKQNSGPGASGWSTSPCGPPTTLGRLTASNRHRMLNPMGKLPKSLARRTVGRFLRFGVLRGLRSVEIDPEEFRQYLADKHNLWIPHFGRMRDVPIEQLDAIAERLIHNAQRIALAQGAGFGLGGMITILPDASLLTIIALRLIQRLCLLYGFEERESERRIQMWLAAAGAAGGVIWQGVFGEKESGAPRAPACGWPRTAAQ